MLGQAGVIARGGQALLGQAGGRVSSLGWGRVHVLCCTHLICCKASPLGLELCAPFALRALFT